MLRSAGPTTFEATFDRYNELCVKGVDEDFGKDPALMVPYGEGPYNLSSLFYTDLKLCMLK